MANDERYVQIRLSEGEIEALKKRADINMRPMAAEGAMIVKLVLAGKGEQVTVPGVNDLNFLGDAGEDARQPENKGEDNGTGSED